YGNITARLSDEQASLYWEHSSGKKAIRINFDMGSGAVLGFNLMGIRYRHEVCEKWIAQGSHIEEVLSNLGIANFDPEFFDTYEEELVQRYNQQTGRTIQLKKKRGLSAALAFLRN
ncbi:MAG: NAD(P)/FAD-dependent oxidoreductase, partial [Saprospiraceae bacterium]